LQPPGHGTRKPKAISRKLTSEAGAFIKAIALLNQLPPMSGDFRRRGASNPRGTPRGCWAPKEWLSRWNKAAGGSPEHSWTIDLELARHHEDVLSVDA